MTKQFLDFGLAKRLKEKGFPQSPDCFNYSSYYDWDGLRKIHPLSNASVWFDPNISKDNLYFAPTISQVLKWLRNEKFILIGLSPMQEYDGDEMIEWCSTIYKADKQGGMSWIEEFYYESYEQAALAGIEYILDNLI